LESFGAASEELLERAEVIDVGRFLTVTGAVRLNGRRLEQMPK
jgi:hypothetical protein